MSRRRCRARTFYLAPGEYRHFNQWAVHAAIGDTTIEILHRNDLHRLRSEHPDWDGRCYIHERTLGDTLVAAVNNDAEKVEVWMLDERSVEGRRPAGPGAIVHKVAQLGVEHCGGKDAVFHIIADRNVAGVVAAELRAIPEPSSQAHYLRFTAAAAAVLDRAAAMRVARHAAATNIVGPDPFLAADTISFAAFERFAPDARADAIIAVWDATQRERAETFLQLSDAAAQIDPNHPWVCLVTDGANAGQNAWLHELAEHANTHLSMENRLEAYDLTADTLRKIVARDREALASCALHPNASDDLLDRYVRHTLKHPSEGFPYPTNPISANAAATIVAALTASNLRRTDNCDRARTALFLAVLATETDPANEPLLLDTLTTFLAAERNRRNPNYIGNELHWLGERHLELTTTGTAHAWKQLVEHRRATADWDRRTGIVKITPVPTDQLERMIATNPGAPERVATQAPTAPGRQLVANLTNDTWYDTLTRAVATVGPLELAGSLPRHIVTELITNTELDDEQLGRLAPTYQRLLRARRMLENSNPAHPVTPVALAATDNGLRSGHTTQRSRSFTQDDGTGVLAAGIDRVQAVRNYRNGTAGPADLAQFAGDNAATRYSFQITTLHAIAAAAIAPTVDHDHLRTIATSTWADHEDQLAASYAGLPTTWEASEWTDTAVRHTRSTARAAADPTTVWPERVTATAELPRPGDRPWELDTEARAALTDTPIDTDTAGALTVHVIDNIAELRANGNQMRNCTAGYADDVAGGDLMVALRDHQGRTHINAHIQRVDDHWEIGEINSRFNSGVSTRDTVAIRTALLDALRPTQETGERT